MKTTTHGLRSVSYLESTLLNDLLNESEFTEYEMKNRIKRWEGPMIDNTYDYVWSGFGGAVTNRFCLCFNIMSILYLSMSFYAHLSGQLYVLYNE